MSIEAMKNENKRITGGRMKERPILFSGPMVRAILDGRKTQTRRVAKPCHMEEDHGEDYQGNCISAGYFPSPPLCPYGRPGDRLWVRESFSCWRKTSDRLYDEADYDGFWYRADADAYGLLGHDGSGPVYADDLLWKPSIHMPRTASRITLEVTGVRAERLNEISGADCIAEGIVEADAPQWAFGLHEAYRDLWERINGPGSWIANPWIWVVEFKRVDQGDQPFTTAPEMAIESGRLASELLREKNT